MEKRQLIEREISMKKLLSFIMIFVCMIGAMGCSISMSKSVISKPVYPKSIEFEDTNSKIENQRKNLPDENFKNALRSFSGKSASKLLNSKKENMNYSPVSLYMALALASAGAAGTTEKEMFEALQLQGKDKDYLANEVGKLYRLLYSDNGIGKLKIGNSVWLQKGLLFNKSYTEKATNSFYASLFNVDFAKIETGKAMGKWVSENTYGTIDPDFKIDQQQILSIMNTIYFKDEWLDKMDEKLTKKDDFYLEDGKSIQCDFMNHTYSNHNFIKGDGYTASSLSLKNDGNVIFILPDKGVHVDELVKDSKKMTELFDLEKVEYGKVVFQIPKFEFDSNMDIKELLKALGVYNAFEESADFSGITDQGAYISSIRQQTHIAIDEKGVEAAAFTAIFYAGSAPAKDKIVELILDRPFIYGITSGDGTLLFVGVCRNPTLR